MVSDISHSAEDSYDFFDQLDALLSTDPSSVYDEVRPESTDKSSNVPPAPNILSADLAPYPLVEGLYEDKGGHWSNDNGVPSDGCLRTGKDSLLLQDQHAENQFVPAFADSLNKLIDKTPEPHPADGSPFSVQSVLPFEPVPNIWDTLFCPEQADENKQVPVAQRNALLPIEYFPPLSNELKLDANDILERLADPCVPQSSLLKASTLGASPTDSSKDEKVLKSSAGISKRCRGKLSPLQKKRNKEVKKKPKMPSRFCHICLRRDTRVNLLPCGNLRQEASCTKTICDKCFDTYQWDWADALVKGLDWKCTHCTGRCPQRAQCHIYNRTNGRRAQRLLDKKARIAAERRAQQGMTN